MNEQERLALEYLSREFSTSEARLYDHIASTFRWFMATSFAANGGAALALLQSHCPLRGQTYALGWLAIGAIFSLLTGALSAAMGLVGIRPITVARGKVQQAIIAEDITELERSFPKLIEEQKMKWWMWSPSAAASIAFGSFVIAVILLAAT